MSKLTSAAKFTIITTLIFTLIIIVIFGFNIISPLCNYTFSEEKEIRKYTMYGTLAIANLFVLVTFFKRTKLNFVCTASILLLIILSLYASSQRHFKLERQYWSFEGIVSKKYNSDNHGAKTITVNGVDYEYIPSELWESISVGDFVVKEACKYIRIKREIGVKSFLLHSPIFN